MVRTAVADWSELADGVLYRRFESWNVNVGLVLGGASAMVIDTRVSPAQGQQLRASVALVTSKPLVAVNTHAHLDHCLGNYAFRDVPILAHHAATATLADEGPRLLREFATSPDAPPLDELEDAQVTVPTESVSRGCSLDLGGREVRLVHHGRGHTAGDLVVEIPETGVSFGGDLIRGDGTPWYGDAFPLEWPITVKNALNDGATTWVPGHGGPMTASEVTVRAEHLRDVAESIRFSWTAGVAASDARAALPINAGNARHAMTRGFAALGAVA